MRHKKNPLYAVMLITGIIVTIFSLLGVAAITGHLPLAQWDTPQVRDSGKETPQKPRPRTISRTGLTALKAEVQSNDGTIGLSEFAFMRITLAS